MAIDDSPTPFATAAFPSVEEMQRQTWEATRDIHRAIYGPRNKPEDGLLIRVRDLECADEERRKADANRKKYVIGMAASAVLMAATSVWNLVWGRVTRP